MSRRRSKNRRWLSPKFERKTNDSFGPLYEIQYSWIHGCSKLFRKVYKQLLMKLSLEALVYTIYKFFNLHSFFHAHFFCHFISHFLYHFYCHSLCRFCTFLETDWPIGLCAYLSIFFCPRLLYCQH